MKHIVCAARGGPRSRPAIAKAIELARQNEARLTFLYIVDYNFLGRATLTNASIVHRQVREMGEFIMLKLQEQAHQAGVEADYAVEEGTVQEGIRHFVHQSGADTVVIGRPAQEASADVFDHDSLAQFAALLEADTGAHVIMVQPTELDSQTS